MLIFFSLSTCFKKVCVINDGYTHYLQNHHISLSETMEVNVFKACCFCWPYDFPNPTVIPISYLAQKREVCDAIYLLNAGGGGEEIWLSEYQRERRSV